MGKECTPAGRNSVYEEGAVNIYVAKRAEIKRSALLPEVQKHHRPGG